MSDTVQTLVVSAIFTILTMGTLAAVGFLMFEGGSLLAVLLLSGIITAAIAYSFVRINQKPSVSQSKDAVEVLDDQL